MGVDSWFVQFVAADKQQRLKLLQGKTKRELQSVAKYFGITLTGNTTNMRNTLSSVHIKLPL